MVYDDTATATNERRQYSPEQKHHLLRSCFIITEQSVAPNEGSLGCGSAISEAVLPTGLKKLVGLGSTLGAI